MRVFKQRRFDKWARKERISDAVLYDAAKEVISGQVEADLGGSLFKKRIAKPGRGKSGGYRTIVGYKRPNSDRVVFLYAFAKNERSNITETDKAALSLAAEGFISAADKEISELLKTGAFSEVRL